MDAFVDMSSNPPGTKLKKRTIVTPAANTNSSLEKYNKIVTNIVFRKRVSAIQP